MKKVILLTLMQIFLLCSLAGCEEEFVPGTQCPIYVTERGSDTRDGSSWGQSKSTVVHGIRAAKQLVNGDNEYATCEVWVGEGAYYPTTGNNRKVSFFLKDGVHLFGGFAGDEEDLDQRDFESNETILSGNIGAQDSYGDNSYHVVVCDSDDGCGDDAIIDGFTIRDGHGPDDDETFPTGYDQGAGMYNSQASPTVSNCKFTKNLTSHCSYTPYAHYCDAKCKGEGGGMYNHYSSPTITNCEFDENAAGELGGGMSNYHSSPTIIDCIFTANGFDTGMAMSVSNDQEGGGIYNKASSPTIINSIFEDNWATDGSAIFSIESPSLTVIESVFRNNSVGAIKSNATANTMINSIFENNDVGIEIAGTSTVIAGCTFRENDRDIYYLGSGTAITNCTFIGNDWGTSIGITTVGSPTITNCIFDNFSDDYGPIIVAKDSSPTISYSNVEGGCENIVGAICGDGNIDEDPLFVDLENGDFHLQSDSPCIDTGLNEALPLDEFDLDDDKDTDELIPFDLDGNNRIVNKIVDMGAFEFQK